jgi:carbamoyl-phosphate synthase large subunit
MEHIEEAGIHSGDSACSLPVYSLNQTQIEEIRRATKMLALELDIKGSINIQFALKDDILYVLEVNPRASRTLPFVSKTTGVQWAKVSTQLILGKTLKELGVTEVIPKHFAVKEAVFPFKRFPGEDILLGPEMKSTGEVMGIDQTFPMAYLKAQIACGQAIPQKGKVFVSVKDTDKHRIIPYVKKLIDLEIITSLLLFSVWYFPCSKSLKLILLIIVSSKTLLNKILILISSL